MEESREADVWIRDFGARGISELGWMRMENNTYILCIFGGGECKRFIDGASLKNALWILEIRSLVVNFSMLNIIQHLY